MCSDTLCSSKHVEHNVISICMQCAWKWHWLPSFCHMDIEKKRLNVNPCCIPCIMHVFVMICLHPLIWSVFLVTDHVCFSSASWRKRVVSMYLIGSWHHDLRVCSWNIWENGIKNLFILERSSNIHDVVHKKISDAFTQVKIELDTQKTFCVLWILIFFDVAFSWRSFYQYFLLKSSLFSCPFHQ
jgi:hypothetical protein